MNILKYPGGKAYFASTIVGMMRPHQIYVEPFFGSGKVFFTKQQSDMNLLSDADSAVINFWEQVRLHPEILMASLKKLPYERRAFEIWRDRFDPKSHNLVHALRVFVLSRMSRSGLGLEFSDSNRLRRGMPEGESSYLSAIEELPKAAAMLGKAGTTILCRDYKDAIKPVLDDPSALIYLDPPYVGAMAMYRVAMTMEQQEEMLKLITDENVKAKIILSGYDNPLYRKYLINRWVLNKIPTVNRMSETKVQTERTECIWRNYF